MTNLFKRSTAIALATLTLATSLPASATNLQGTSPQTTISYTSSNAESTQKYIERITPNIKGTLRSIPTTLKKAWNKLPKVAKMAIIGTPGIILCGRFYVNDIKPAEDARVGIKKLIKRKNEILENYSCKLNLTESEKAEIFLIDILQVALMNGQTYDNCSALMDLILVDTIDRKNNIISSLDTRTLFGLSQLFQLVLLNIGHHDNDKQPFISDIYNKITSLKPEIVERLRKLIQETLSKNNLTIKKHLGSGQSGEVYLCTDNNNQEVAVKIIPNNGGLVSALALKNEKNVCRYLVDIESNNIVKYTNPSPLRQNGIVGFSMEYVKDARDLTTVAPSDRKQVLNWAEQLFSGLKSLHSKNIAHRDIKLENLLLTKDGHIKICDFGLSTRSTLSTTICGTPIMMAPEINKFHPFWDKYEGRKADIYSAAMVVYCLMFDKKICVADILDLNNARNEAADENKKDRFGNAIGKEAASFFAACLNPNPNVRPTASEALELLKKFNKN